MRAEYRDMSLFRFSQVFRGIKFRNSLVSTMPFAKELLSNADEPKPIGSLVRILEKI